MTAEIVFVIGGPGAGKGTQCQMISKQFNYVHLSIGDLLRSEMKSGSSDGLKIRNLINEGKLVPVKSKSFDVLRLLILCCLD
jgi:adenylate kinase family enzyme